MGLREQRRALPVEADGHRVGPPHRAPRRPPVAGAALAAAAGSTGAFTGFETHEVFDQDAQARIMKLAKTAMMSYKAPTA